MAYTDGGADHNVTFIRVQLSLVAFAVENNVDILVAGRTAGGHSYVNPCERTMSTTNLALMNVALARDEGSDEFEKTMKVVSGSKSLADALDSPEKVAQYKASMDSTMTSLVKRFGQLEYTGKQYKTFPANDEKDMSADLLRFIGLDNTVDLLKSKSAKLITNNAAKEWMDKHTRQGHYAFQVRKILGCKCRYCALPRRMASSKSYDWLPFPEMDQGLEYYKPFSEVYGKSSVEKEVPSKMEGSGKKSVSFSNSIDCSKQQARSKITCSECSMPRVVYSRKKPTPVEMKLLEKWTDDVEYVCGFPLFEMDPPHTPVGFTVELQVKNSVRCHSPVEKNIYHLSPNICFHCGAPSGDQVNLKTTFYPQCGNCVATNIPAVVNKSKLKKGVK